MLTLPSQTHQAKLAHVLSVTSHWPSQAGLMAADCDDGFDLLRDGPLSFAQVMSSQLCTLCLLPRA